MEIKMKRKIKFICTALLAVMLAVSFASCAKDDTPDGYQLIACEGDEFRLYVPTQWISNTTGGVTSAYYTSDAETSVSVHKADDAKGLTLDEYWQICDEKYRAELDSYAFDGKCDKIVLGGKPGQKYVFSAKMTRFNDLENKSVTKEYKFLQAMAQYNGETYILLFSAPSDSFDTLIETVEGNAEDEGIIPYFRFDAPFTSEDNEKKFDEKVEAPEGMKLASTNERPYRLFVPLSWIINKRTDATAAYASDNDSSNVNVQMYMTSSNTETVSDHWKRLEEGYKNTFPSYTLISDEEIKMDGVPAHKYTYTVTSGGREYKIVQAIVKKGEMFYYLTYTALPENFEKHLPDVEKMIENFDIR